MPIGNLTSQLFANVYLNEFDRYVRHAQKPLGYLRYGDDFVLFGQTEAQVRVMRQDVEAFLWHELHLSVHTGNIFVGKVAHGLHFLGHHIYPNSISVNPAMTRKVRREPSPHNRAGYWAQHLPRTLRRDISWI